MTDATLLKRVIRKTGLTQADFAAEVFGVSRATLTRILNGTRRLKPPEKKFLRGELAAIVHD